MLAEVVPYLRCPLCAAGLAATGPSLRCERGHSFNVARQGYVNLLTGRAPAGADTVAMVEARAAVLAAGHFDAITDAVTRQATTGQVTGRQATTRQVTGRQDHHPPSRPAAKPPPVPTPTLPTAPTPPPAQPLPPVPPTPPAQPLPTVCRGTLFNKKRQ